jgi:hypothetical protein
LVLEWARRVTVGRGWAGPQAADASPGGAAAHRGSLPPPPGPRATRVLVARMWHAAARSAGNRERVRGIEPPFSAWETKIESGSPHRGSTLVLVVPSFERSLVVVDARHLPSDVARMWHDRGRDQLAFSGRTGVTRE